MGEPLRVPSHGPELGPPDHPLLSPSSLQRAGDPEGHEWSPTVCFQEGSNNCFTELSNARVGPCTGRAAGEIRAPGPGSGAIPNLV